MAMSEKQLAGNEIKNSYDRILKSYITKNNERHASRATLMSTKISHIPDAWQQSVLWEIFLSHKWPPRSVMPVLSG